MIELGKTAPQSDYVKDSNEATFMADVVDESQNQPVIVDFWAPWCGPCKTLGPALEAEIQAAGGKVKMVKVDIDQNQMIAQQMRVQSIPAVFAFVNGQPVDGFMGAKAPSEIKEFIAKIVSEHGTEDAGLEEAVEAAQEMLDQGEADAAAETFAAIIEEDATLLAAHVGLAKSQIALNDTDAANATLEAVPANMVNDPEITGLKAQLALAAQAADSGDVADLKAKLDADDNDHQARYDLSLAQMVEGNAEAAINELLELFRRDRDWNDDAARQQLFKIFDSLGPKDPLALTGRRKLSSMLFA